MREWWKEGSCCCGELAGCPLMIAGTTARNNKVSFVGERDYFFLTRTFTKRRLENWKKGCLLLLTDTKRTMSEKHSTLQIEAIDSGGYFKFHNTYCKFYIANKSAKGTEIVTSQAHNGNSVWWGAIAGCNLGALEPRLTSGSPSSDPWTEVGDEALFLLLHHTIREQTRATPVGFIYGAQVEKVFSSGRFIPRVSWQ